MWVNITQYIFLESNIFEENHHLETLKTPYLKWVYLSIFETKIQYSLFLQYICGIRYIRVLFLCWFIVWISSSAHKYQMANFVWMQSGMLHIKSSFFSLSVASCFRRVFCFSIFKLCVCVFFLVCTLILYASSWKMILRYVIRHIRHSSRERSSKNHFCNIFDKLTSDPQICLRDLCTFAYTARSEMQLITHDSGRGFAVINPKIASFSHYRNIKHFIDLQQLWTMNAFDFK